MHISCQISVLKVHEKKCQGLRKQLINKLLLIFWSHRRTNFHVQKMKFNRQKIDIIVSSQVTYMLYMNNYTYCLFCTFVRKRVKE